MFQLQNVSFSYKGATDFQLGPIDVRIPAHEITTLIGTNGSGKTTLINILLQISGGER